MRLLPGFALIAALGLAGRDAMAQASNAPVTIVPRGGYLVYHEATSLQNAGFVGLETMYNITRWLSVGPSLAISRAQTNEADFPAALTAGDTTFLFQAKQGVTLLDAGLAAHIRLPELGRFAPYALGGVGYYTMYLDPQTNDADTRYGRASFQLGGGADIRLTQRSGIRIELRDLMMYDYDRERLNPVGPRFNGYQRFDSLFPARTESYKGATYHNLQIAIGFTFRPSIGGEAGGAEEDRIR